MRQLLFILFFSFFSTLLFGQREDSVYVYPEVSSHYYGGVDSILAYLSRTVNYPPKAIADLSEGTAVVHFIIEKNGRIEEAWVEESVTPEIDKESIRVILGMPNWRPAINGGVTVRSLNKLPLNYSLDSDKLKRKKEKKRKKVKKKL
jgi:protein TonB